MKTVAGTCVLAVALFSVLSSVPAANPETEGDTSPRITGFPSAITWELS